MKNYYFKMLIGALVITGLSIFAYYYYSPVTYERYSLNDAFDYYGFKSATQKKAMHDLLESSSFLPAIEGLPIRTTKEELVYDIINFVDWMQKMFTIRTGLQERWDTKGKEWMNQDKDKILGNLRELGFVDAIQPKEKDVHAVCILGAIGPRMETRMNYLDFLINSGLKTKTIILLAGERYVTEGIDGTKEQLMEIANKLNFQDWTKLTETHLINQLYTTSSLYNRNIPTHIIDTPKGDLPRPTTQTTILKLIEWLKNHQEIKNVTFVSNQPYVQYQEAIIDLIFKEQNIDIKYEVVGTEVENTDVTKSILEALGSYIWAATPRVLSDMYVRITDEASNSLKELYSKNPLVYNAIPALPHRH